MNSWFWGEGGLVGCGEGCGVGGEVWGERRGEWREGRREEYLLDTFVLLLLGFEALAGGDGGLEVWRVGIGGLGQLSCG